ncbi:MAG TPA: amino acid racemase [Spirochaetia bacterium]|nr:amino acid racemase [Spirochaetia bacterium]
MKSNGRKAIGIVGGVGPYAGLDLNQKIFASTTTRREQDHFEVYLLSCPSLIGDRTEYLLDPAGHVNPGIAIYEVIRKLSLIGAEVIGVPCNTSHAAPILDLVLQKIDEDSLGITFVNMIEETVRHIVTTYPGIRRVGLLATRGSYESGVYTATFKAHSSIEVLNPPMEGQESVHAAIYDPQYGIKNHPNPIAPEAQAALRSAAEDLIAEGAEAIIMGCTEIPLAMRPVELSVPRIDATLVLARALIARAEA